MTRYTATNGTLWFIARRATPLPDRRWDWHFWADEYTGPGDRMQGSAADLAACQAEIEELVAAEGGICASWDPTRAKEARDGE